MQLPELHQLEYLLTSAPAGVQLHLLGEIPDTSRAWPFYMVQVGQAAADKPALLLTAGVHGLERIGSQVLLAYLETLCARLSWDESLHRLLEQVQLYVVPIVNPAGMSRGWRSNAQHVDLMRNAPVECVERPLPLIGGHRYSKRLPWHRGDPTQMEVEALLLQQLLKDYLLPRASSIVLDCHSGFGQTDRLWFPYARSALQPIAHLAHMHRLRELFFQTYPHQNYIFEPQSAHYLCHGDLWDFFYQQALERQHLMLPLTLEMGSWNWVRKNPFQLLRAQGLYHPVKPHRVKRVLRGHLILLDFLVHATAAMPTWLPTVSQRNSLEALDLWYRRT